MVIMISRYLPFSATSPRLLRSRRLPSLAFSIFLGAAMCGSAQAYVTIGKSWPAGSTVVLQLGLGNPVLPLADGSPTWNDAVLPVLAAWNEQVSRVQLTGVMNSAAAASSGDRVNSVVFSPTVFGQAFGRSTLAVTYYITQGSNMMEADVLFNSAQVFDSYRGPLRFGAA